MSMEYYKISIFCSSSFLNQLTLAFYDLLTVLVYQFYTINDQTGPSKNMNLPNRQTLPIKNQNYLISSSAE